MLLFKIVLSRFPISVLFMSLYNLQIKYVFNITKDFSILSLNVFNSRHKMQLFYVFYLKSKENRNERKKFNQIRDHINATSLINSIENVIRPGVSQVKSEGCVLMFVICLHLTP